MVIGAGVCLATGGLFMRTMDAADGWQVLFFRSLSVAAFFGVVLAFRSRGHLLPTVRGIGKIGALVVVLNGIGSICYIQAVVHTTVANVVFILSATPMVTAFLGWAFMGEKVWTSTWLAILLAMAGIGVMVAGGLAFGHMTGVLLACVVPLTYGFMIAMVRHSAQRDMMPVPPLAALLSAAIAAPMVGDFALGTGDFVRCMVMGVVQSGMGFLLMTLGARHVPANEAGLLALSEIAVAPLLVWVFVNEVPAAATLLGGAMVVVAVVANALAGIRRDRLARVAV